MGVECRVFRSIAVVLALAVGLSSTCGARAEDAFRSPDILVLGDSQLSFGAGQAFVDFFRQNAALCGLSRDMSVGVIGVRSSSLAGFTAASGPAKGLICDVDKTWKVNAGVYGVLKDSKNPYRQIGQGKAYQFCQKGVTPFQAMFARGYYMPRLLVMFFLGNATDRWAGNPADAMEDVRRTMHDLPPDLPCIFMTTAPAYDLATVRIRQRAQANIAAAFESEGRRCTFVEGYTPETIAENRGNSANFRRKPSGKVKDPYHPTEAAARQFLALRRGELCRAITKQMTPD